MFAACSAPPAPTAVPRPDVPVVAEWPAGTAFRATLAASVPDEMPWRAAIVWWREALRQSDRLRLSTTDDPSVPALELLIDPAAGTLLAMLRVDGDDRVLAGDRFTKGELPQAIDRLAWAARIAVGDGDGPAPLPVAAGTSANAFVVDAVNDALQLLHQGGPNAARSLLHTSRARDGGAPFVLDGVAAVALLGGDLAAAERTAQEALGYRERLLPTTQHRLARTLLLARASLQPENAGLRDAELRQLGETFRRERPHDPEGALSCGIAANFLGDFAAARAELQPLRTLLPEHPIVAYHLGLAQLASGDAAAAADTLTWVAPTLPTGWLLLPRAIALYEAGRHDDLQQVLLGIHDDDSAEGRALRHEVLAMLASHALLRGDVQGACARLQQGLDWLARNPLLLQQRLGEFAERGAVLIRLGGGERLPSLLAAVQAQHATTPVADACSFLGGLLHVHHTGTRATQHEQALARDGDNLFGELLQAYGHERRGEIADMQAALARAARLSSSPLTKALLARGLAAAGRTAEAEQLHGTLRRELLTFRLRQTCQHPLFGPELAYAFLGQ